MTMKQSVNKGSKFRIRQQKYSYYCKVLFPSERGLRKWICHWRILFSAIRMTFAGLINKDILFHQLCCYSYPNPYLARHDFLVSVPTGLMYIFAEPQSVTSIWSKTKHSADTTFRWAQSMKTDFLMATKRFLASNSR